MSDKYLLNDDHTVRPVDDLIEWAIVFEDPERRRVARTAIAPNVAVSTVFLGLDHSFGGGPPLLFESMVFGGERDGDQDRYSTWDEAVAGHERMVASVREGISA